MGLYRYVGRLGKHMGVAPGDVVELSDEAYASFKDRFERVVETVEAVENVIDEVKTQTDENDSQQ